MIDDGFPVFAIPAIHYHEIKYRLKFISGCRGGHRREKDAPFFAIIHFYMCPSQRLGSVPAFYLAFQISPGSSITAGMLHPQIYWSPWAFTGRFMHAHDITITLLAALSGLKLIQIERNVHRPTYQVTSYMQPNIAYYDSVWVQRDMNTFSCPVITINVQSGVDPEFQRRHHQKSIYFFISIIFWTITILYFFLNSMTIL